MMPDGKFVGPCHRCRCDMWLPMSLYEAACKSERIGFFCPYGHEQIFKQGETEETLLRRERDRLKQQLAQRDDEITTQSKLIANLKTQRAKVTKRISHGVCPCCNRTFAKLAAHMKTKHPDFAKAA